MSGSSSSVAMTPGRSRSRLLFFVVAIAAALLLMSEYSSVTAFTSLSTATAHHSQRSADEVSSDASSSLSSSDSLYHTGGASLKDRLTRVGARVFCPRDVAADDVVDAVDGATVDAAATDTTSIDLSFVSQTRRCRLAWVERSFAVHPIVSAIAGESVAFDDYFAAAADNDADDVGVHVAPPPPSTAAATDVDDGHSPALTQRCINVRQRLHTLSKQHRCAWPTDVVVASGSGAAPGPRNVPFSFFHLYHHDKGHSAMYTNTTTAWPSRIGGPLRAPCDFDFDWLSGDGRADAVGGDGNDAAAARTRSSTITKPTRRRRRVIESSSGVGGVLGAGSYEQTRLAEYAPIMLIAAVAQRCLPRMSKYMVLSSWKLDSKKQPLPCGRMTQFDFAQHIQDDHRDIVTWSRTVLASAKHRRRTARKFPAAVSVQRAFWHEVLGVPLATWDLVKDTIPPWRAVEANQSNVIASRFVYAEFMRVVVVFNAWLHARHPELPRRCMDLPKARYRRCLCYPLESILVDYVHLFKRTHFLDPDVDDAVKCKTPIIPPTGPIFDAAPRHLRHLDRAYAAVMWRRELAVLARVYAEESSSPSSESPSKPAANRGDSNAGAADSDTAELSSEASALLQRLLSDDFATTAPATT